MNLNFLRRPGALLAIAGLALSVGGCETDLDPNDEYRETTLLYAVLDPRLPLQKISINKAFLNTKSNAITIAAEQPDSVTFPAGVIEASLQFLRADSSVKIEVPLQRVANTGKEPGQFANAGQAIFQTPPIGFQGYQGLDPDTAISYRVVVRNLRTGTVTQGTTNLPLVYPDPSANSLYFTSAYGSIGRDRQNDPREFDPSPQTVTPRVAIKTQRRAGIYSVELDFRFFEITGANTVRRTLTWSIATNERPIPGTTDDIIRQLPNDAFFTDFLLRQINYAADPPGLRRVIDQDANRPAITFRATAGSPQWARYQEVLTASSALTQVTPEYTNVRGGRGLVTGRGQHSVQQSINLLPGPLPNGKGRTAFGRHPKLKFTF